MSTTPETLSLLGRAAELRAAGNPWTETATQLAVDLGQLRQLTSTHTRDYERLSRRARNELQRESLDAALAALRQQLKSPDERVKFLAASTIIRYELARMRHGEKESRAILERRQARRRRERFGFDPEMLRAPNVQETTEVPKQQEVIPAKNVAQTTPPTPPPTPPAPTSPAPKPAPRPVIAVGGTGQPSAREEVMRRGRQKLLTAAVRGQELPLGPPPSHNDGLLTSWLGQ